MRKRPVELTTRTVAQVLFPRQQKCLMCTCQFIVQSATMHCQGLEFSKACAQALAVSPTVAFVPIITSNVNAVEKACNM